MKTDKEIEELVKIPKTIISKQGKAIYISAYIEGFKAAQSKLYSEEEVNMIIRRFENELCQQFKYGNIDVRVKLVNNYIVSIKKK